MLRQTWDVLALPLVALSAACLKPFTAAAAEWELEACPTCLGSRVLVTSSNRVVRPPRFVG